MTESERNEQFYRDTESIAFPKLDDRQISLVEAIGQRRTLRKGECLFRAGQRKLGMTVILNGEVEVYETRDGVEQILATSGPRDFVGDIAMLNGTSALVSARGKAEQSDVLEVSADNLRKALAELPGLGEPVVSALIMRRERLQRDPEYAGLRVVALSGSREGHLLHDFLDKNHVPHRVLVAESPEGVALCDRLNLYPRELPAIISATGIPLRRPSLREVAQIAGLLRPLARDDEEQILCDVAVVGAGPAGLAAAVNSASEGLDTIVLESYASGGQAGSSSLIENFFGFPTGISGGDLTYRAQLQAYRFGARFTTPAQALSLSFCAGEYPAQLQIEGYHSVLRAKCVIIATGAEYRRIDAEGREDFEGSGVYYAATALEGQICAGATVVVAGGGNSAGQAAMFLSECAAHVFLIIRGTDLCKSMSSYLALRVQGQENIEILRRTEIRRMMGNKKLEAVELEDMETHARRVVETAAVFSMIGAKPCTHWLPKEIETDDKGFIKTGPAVAHAPSWQNAERAPGALETSRPGIFAAGDVRSGSVKRCAAAVGEGGMAVEGVHSALGTYG